MYNKFCTFQLLVSHGANTRDVNKKGSTALHEAAQEAHIAESAVAALVEANNDPAFLNDRNNDGNTALIEAAAMSYWEEDKDARG